MSDSARFDPASATRGDSPTVADLQRTIDAWIRTIGQRYFHELTNLAQLTEEVGEVARLLSRTAGEQSFRDGTEPEDLTAALGDELADVLFVVVCLANQSGVDLTEAIDRNLSKKSIRDADRHRDNAKLELGFEPDS